MAMGKRKLIPFVPEGNNGDANHEINLSIAPLGFGSCREVQFWELHFVGVLRERAANGLNLQ